MPAFCMICWDSKIQNPTVRWTVGPLRLDEAATIIFAKGENADESLASHQKSECPFGYSDFCIAKGTRMIQCGANERRRRGLDRAEPLFLPIPGQKCKRVPGEPPKKVVVGDGVLDVPAVTCCFILKRSANSQHFPAGRPGGRPLHPDFSTVRRAKRLIRRTALRG